MTNFDLVLRLFLQLTVILAACRVVGIIGRKFGQTQVVLEMVAGVLLGPSFFVDEALGDDVGPWLSSLIGGDPRFFFLGAAGAGDDGASYNYNGNSALDDAIAAGARGAYWDILRGLGRR